MITNDEFIEWKNHPVTQNLFKNMSDLKSSIIECWMAGTSFEPTINARWVGTIEFINELLNFNPISEKEKK